MNPIEAVACEVAAPAAGQESVGVGPAGPNGLPVATSAGPAAAGVQLGTLPSSKTLLSSRSPSSPVVAASRPGSPVVAGSRSKCHVESRRGCIPVPDNTAVAGSPSPPPHHEGSRGRGRGNNDHGGGPRTLGVAGVLAPPEHQQQQSLDPEDLEGEPMPWTESLATGGPLHYVGLMKMQINALQVGLGLERVSCPNAMDTVCNPAKRARVRNLMYTGDCVRKVRLSYLDTPGMQVYSTISYGSPSQDFPLLGVSAMAMPRTRVLAFDLQPLFSGAEYAEKYAETYAKLRAIRDRHPRLNEGLRQEYFRGSPFFSESLVCARWGPEEADGFMEDVVMPAFQECVQVYVDLVSQAPTSGVNSLPQKAVLDRHAEFDRFHAEREQVRPMMTANFGASFTETYVSEFMFAYGFDRMQARMCRASSGCAGPRPKDSDNGSSDSRSYSSSSSSACTDSGRLEGRHRVRNVRTTAAAVGASGRKVATTAVARV
eukprot:jgi/Undpi1/5073/HiC_scaffold_19.g08425.m1